MAKFRVEWFNVLPRATRKYVYKQLGSKKWDRKDWNPRPSNSNVGYNTQNIELNHHTIFKHDKKGVIVASNRDPTFSAHNHLVVALDEKNNMVGFAVFGNGSNEMVLTDIALDRKHEEFDPVILTGLLDKGIEAAKSQRKSIRRLLWPDEFMSNIPEHIEEFIDYKFSGEKQKKSIMRQLENAFRIESETIEAEKRVKLDTILLRSSTRDPLQGQLSSVRESMVYWMLRFTEMDPNDPLIQKTIQEHDEREKEILKRIAERNRKWNPKGIPRISGNMYARRFNGNIEPPKPKRPPHPRRN